MTASRLLAAALCLQTACSSAPEHLQSVARAQGLQTLTLVGEPFTLTCFYKPTSALGRTLHVYIEGDGSPWVAGRLPALEPTTRESVMLPLMRMDGAPALYLGRPCYNGHADDPGCSERLWTHARHGAEVVHAMQGALNRFISQQIYTDVVLIGHSGGGALAMLMAGHVPEVRHVVTLAGNYDIDVWADHHGYQRLSESLNPAHLANHDIPEWHFLAENDRIVPPALFVSELKKRPNSQVEIVPGADHVHGWSTIWLEVLSRLRERGH